MVVSAKYRSEQSVGGHSLSVLKSALQKYIRRGEEVLALQTAREFHSFAGAPPVEADQVKRIRTNYVHRLMVIVLEDVSDLVLIAGLADGLRVIAELPFGDPESKRLETIVIRLACAWPKSRAGSHAKAVATLPLAPWPEQHPLVSKYQDLHAALLEYSKPEAITAPLTTWTAKFAQLIASAQASGSLSVKIEALFWGWRIANSDQPFTPTVLFPRRRKGIWIALSTAISMNARAGQRWDVMAQYLEHLGGIQERHLCWLLPTLAAIGLSPAFPQPSPLPPVTSALLQAVQTQPYEIKPYVLDKHVGSHQLRTKEETDGQRFVNEGSVVHPEAPPSLAMFREIYVDRKIGPRPAAEQLDPESSRYRLVLRTQLVTGDGKTDSYFAYPTGRQAQASAAYAHRADRYLVVVKGPFPTSDRYTHALTSVLLINRLKAGLGLLPNPNLRIEMMRPDLWGGGGAGQTGTPLGMRKACSSDRPAYFLVSSSWVSEKDLDTRFHSSKLWPPTIVVDWTRRLQKHVFGPEKMRDWQMHGPELLEQYVLHLYLRFVMGVGDHADRNFLIVNDTCSDRLVAVDEEPSNNPATSLRSVLREERTKIVREWVAANLHKMQAFLGHLMILLESERATVPYLDGPMARAAKLAHEPLSVL